MLTETKASDGCRLLADAFGAAGYTVIFPEPAAGDCGVMIISRLPAEPDPITQSLTYLPARAAGAVLTTDLGPLRILGAYVPSRDASLEKTERKQRWLTEFTAALAGCTESALLLGDLNVLEPNHQPRYRFFADFEYDFYQALTDHHDLADAFRHLHPDRVEHSWVGRTGDGYRYDHAHCSKATARRAGRLRLRARASADPIERSLRPHGAPHPQRPRPVANLRPGRGNQPSHVVLAARSGSSTPCRCPRP